MTADEHDPRNDFTRSDVDGDMVCVSARIMSPGVLVSVADVTTGQHVLVSLDPRAAYDLAAAINARTTYSQRKTRS